MRPTSWRRPGILLSLVAIGLLLAAPVAAGAVEHRTGNTVTVGANEVIEDDLVAAGDTVVVDGVIKGDLVAAAQTVVVNGRIEGDLLAAAGSVRIAGTVTDDARIAGAAVQLAPRATVGDSLLMGGASLELQPGSRVGGSVLFGGSQALLAGEVAQDVLFGGQGLELRGPVGGDVTAYVGGRDEPAVLDQVRVEGAPPPPRVRSGLMVAETARVAGDLAYTSPQDTSLPPQAVAGTVAYTPAPRDASTPVQAADHWLLVLLRRYAALLLVGLLLVWVAPKFARAVPAELERQPLASLGWGVISIVMLVLTFLLLPLITMALAVTFGVVKLTGLMGIVIALGLLALFALIVLAVIAIAYLAQIAVSYELGRLILLRLQPAWAERPYAPLALGLAVLVALAALPAVGWLFSTAAVLLGLGALWLFGRDTVRHQPIAFPPGAVPVQAAG
jgi:cytoskeletal protein CcmA (bactofilin family)